MSVKITTPLAAVRTGARWSQDIVLQNADGTPRGGLAGMSPRVALVPQSQPRRSADSFALPAEHLAFWADEGRVGIRVPAEATRDYALGDFALELLLADDDDIESVATGTVAIEQGLQLIAEGQESVSITLAGAGAAAGTIIIKTAKAATATGQGPKGDDGQDGADGQNGQDGKDGHTPTDAEVKAVVDPAIASATAELLLRLQALENAQPRTPPAWVFGASPLRLFGAGGTQAIYPPASSRMTDAADVWIPPQPAGWRVIFVNFACNSDTIALGAGRELLPGNSNTLDFVVAFTGQNGTGTRTVLTFGGAGSTVMADGGFAISDPVATAFPGGWIRTSITTPAGGKRPGGWTANAAFGEKRNTLSAPNPALAAGGILAGGTPDNARGYQPLGILVPGNSVPASVALFGDSITQQDDAIVFASARGMLGGFVRGLDATSTMPSFGVGNFGHHGASVIDFMDIAPGSLKFSQRHALLKHIKDAINHGRWPMTAIWSQALRNDFSGMNDATAEGALAQMKTRAQTWWNWLHATFEGVPIIQSTVSARVTADATTGYTTIEGQVPRQPTVSGGALPSFNDWVVSRPAPLFLGVDLRPAVEEVGPLGPVLQRTTFTRAGGGALSNALAASVAVASINITATTAPIAGTYLVLEPGTANFELRGTIQTVTANGGGSYTLSFVSAITPAKAHAAGAVVMTANTNDGTHLGSAVHQAAAPIVEATKPKIKSLVAA